MLFNKYLQQVDAHDAFNSHLLLPNDAIFFMRLTQFESFCNLVEDLMQQSNKPEKEVLLKGKKILSEIKVTFPLVGSAIEYIINLNTKEN